MSLLILELDLVVKVRYVGYMYLLDTGAIFLVDEVTLAEWIKVST